MEVVVVVVLGWLGSWMLWWMLWWMALLLGGGRHCFTPVEGSGRCCEAVASGAEWLQVSAHAMHLPEGLGGTSAHHPFAWHPVCDQPPNLVSGITLML